MDDNKKLSDADLANALVEDNQEYEDTLVTTGDELITPALDSEAGQEALAADEAQGDNAPINDAAATGEYSDEGNINTSDNAGEETVDTEIETEKEIEDSEATAEQDASENTDEQSEEVESNTIESETIESTSNVENNEETAATAADIDAIVEGDPNEDPNAKWYVVHTYSGHENKVATTLKQKVISEGLDAKILEVLVPTQDKIEIRGGKKATVKEKIFPGYILVKMVLDDLSWLAVRTTPGVTSFVGMSNKPTPIPASEVRTIVKFMTQGAAPSFKDVFLVDDTVKIIEGPFAQFIGKVDSVDKDRGKVKVLVSIFGRETPVELDFLQVQKL